VLPDDADIAKVAAAMNPAMSSWVALRRRVPVKPGQSILVLGATGNAGAMANTTDLRRADFDELVSWDSLVV
jgi:NADPH:quinone reductase-like Zn-dependent oxidoreductase